MFSSGLFGLLKLSKVSSDMFVCVYMMLFAMILFLYEAIWWRNVGWVARGLRKNFGFLFGIKGKAFFILFIAFLNFGL